WRHRIGYFSPNAHDEWVLHTWSLAVEWQFYLLFPLFLLGVWRWWPHRRRRIVLALCAAGFAVSLYFSYLRPDIAFFLLPARLWELLLGALVWLYPVNLPRRAALAASVIGHGLIVASIVLIQPEARWPGWLALLPTLGTLAVLYANRPLPLLRGCAVQGVGAISYSLYMWHWPALTLLYFVAQTQTVLPSLLTLAALVPVSVGSYSLLEIRLRSALARPGVAQAGMGAAVVAVLGAAGAVLALGGMVPGRAADLALRDELVKRNANVFLDPRATYWRACDRFETQQRTGSDAIPAACTAGPPGGVFLWGDSHAGALYPALRAHIPAAIPLDRVTAAGCMPGLDPVPSTALCGRAIDYALAAIARLRPHIVLIVMRKDQNQHYLPALTARLHRMGVAQVVLLGPAIMWTSAPSRAIVRRHWTGASTGPVWIADGSIDWIFRTQDIAFQRQMRGADATVISLADALCRGDQCLARLGGGAMLQDDTQHPTLEGADFIVRTIVMPRLRPLLPAPKLDSGHAPG
ncbi:acyltransferase family protein, partial [Sphingomonas sp.]|uniref:acyltransferase family protein n=1 Tax=Sphingomonas sp. TaxID=28214 RepID=UPI00334185B1